MNQIGELLKKTREEQGLSLEDVANKTKIHIYKLKAIEEGNKSALPAKVFTVGLIKSYARELKIDLNKISKLCDEAFEFQPEAIEISNIPADDEPQETQPVGLFQISKTVSILLSVLVTLGLLVVIYLVIEKMNSYSKEELLPNDEIVLPIEEKPETIDAIGSPQKPKEESLSQEGTKAKASKELKKSFKTQAVTQTEVEPKESSPAAITPVVPIPKQEEIPPQKPNEDKKEIVETPVPTTTSTNDQEQASATAEKAKNPEEITSKSESPQAEKAPTEEQPQPTESNNPPASKIVRSDNKLIVTSLEPVRLEIVWSDGYVQVMLLKEQETKTLVFSTPIQVRINNGGAVKVSFNESDAKVPGALNQPIELNYP